MQRWDGRIVGAVSWARVEDELGAQGWKGWEVVSVHHLPDDDVMPFRIVFKRPVPFDPFSGEEYP